MAMTNSWKPTFLASLALVCSLYLQGCDNVNPPKHFVGFWQAKINYLIKYQFYVPGEPASKAILNSCSRPNISASLLCGGHGRCRTWADTAHESEDKHVKRVAFCDCNMYWADPECRTARKSQTTAFFLSLFLGMFGADHLYLGFTSTAFSKLVTGGGLGAWWLYDVCRIGTSAVASFDHFAVAEDLPHYAFVLCTSTLFLCIGFVIAFRAIHRQRVSKKHEFSLMRLDEDEEEFEDKIAKQYFHSKPHNLGIVQAMTSADDDDDDDAPQESMPIQPQTVPFSGYGATIPTMPAWCISGLPDITGMAEDILPSDLVQPSPTTGPATQAPITTTYAQATPIAYGSRFVAPGTAAPIASTTTMYSPVTVSSTVAGNNVAPLATPFFQGNTIGTTYGGFRPAPTPSTLGTTTVVTNAV